MKNIFIMNEMYCYDTGFEVECIPYDFENNNSDLTELGIDTIFSIGILFLFLIMLLEMFTTIKILSSKKDKPKYLVTIIRGLPGSGKTNLIYNLEKDREKVYSICNSNNYFYDDENEYNFKTKLITNSELYCYNKFLNSMKDKIGRIYVLGNFNKKWMYQNYIDAAELNKYEVKIIELECPSKNHLNYFSKRCKYEFPIKKSLSLLKNWETDNRAFIQEPYIEELPGDSLPSLKTITKKQLDKELDNYLKNTQECHIDSGDDDLKLISNKNDGEKINNLNIKEISSDEYNDISGYEVEYSDKNDVSYKNVLGMFDEDNETIFH
jgi:hypothetical protein